MIYKLQKGKFYTFQKYFYKKKYINDYGETYPKYLLILNIKQKKGAYRSFTFFDYVEFDIDGKALFNVEFGEFQDGDFHNYERNEIDGEFIFDNEKERQEILKNINREIKEKIKFLEKQKKYLEKFI